MASGGSDEEIKEKKKLRFELAEQRRLDGEKSLAEHKAKGNAILAKTVRLRALRLSKEAQDATDRLAATEQPARKETVTKSPLKSRAAKVSKAAS